MNHDMSNLQVTEQAGNNVFLIRFRRGSWFRVQCRELPTKLRVELAEIILVEPKFEVLKRRGDADAAEVNYVCDLYRKGEATGDHLIPKFVLLHVFDHTTRQRPLPSIILASPQFQYIVFGSHPSEVYSALRLAHFGTTDAELTKLDEQIASMSEQQRSIETEKEKLRAQRRKMLMASPVNFTLRERLAFLDWDDIRKDSLYLGDAYRCVACESPVDLLAYNSLWPNAILEVFGSEYTREESLFVRCTNTGCDHSAGDTYHISATPPAWVSDTEEESN